MFSPQAKRKPFFVVASECYHPQATYSITTLKRAPLTGHGRF